MSRISFAQVFSLIKGANYSNHLYFTPLKFFDLTTGIKLQQIPISSAFVPDALNSTALGYILANSSNSFDSKLVFKYGGRLIDTEVATFQGYELKTKILESGSVRFELGDVHALLSSPSISNSSDFTLVNSREFIHTTRPNITQSRCALIYTPLTGTGSNEGSYQPSATGYFSIGTKNNTELNSLSVYWEGYVKPLEKKASDGITNNNCVIDDFRIWVGAGRDHAAWNNLYHPQVGGTSVSMGLDLPSAVFASFIDVNDGIPKWWALLRITNNDLATIQFIATPTNLSIYENNKLEVSVVASGAYGAIIWKANGLPIQIHNVDMTNGTYQYEENAVFLGASIRNLKYQRSGSTIIPNSKQEMVTKYFTITQNTSLGTSLVDVELELQNTGLQLLKKLK